MQEVFHVLQGRRLKVRFKAKTRPLLEGVPGTPRGHFVLTVHVLQDSVFQKYQNELRWARSLSADSVVVSLGPHCQNRV